MKAEKVGRLQYNPTWNDQSLEWRTLLADSWV